MTTFTKNRTSKSRVAQFAACVLLLAASAIAADSAPEVNLNATKAGPRTLEPLTQRAILRDYKFAWQNLAQALASNSAAPLNGLFEGTASTWLHDSVSSQSRSGISSQYLNQTHKLDAVFYAPEGDLIELHDTAEYDLQISDGGKTIHNEHAVVRYVVLMTPGADRWVIRQLQAVPQF
jgi:hypothetical protein